MKRKKEEINTCQFCHLSLIKARKTKSRGKTR
jgi:hypothetical protein